MNRHIRRAAAKNGRSDLVAAAGQLQKVLGQAEALKGFQEAPKLFQEIQETVDAMSRDLGALASELHLRQQVLPQLLAELTGKSLSEVVAIEAVLLAKMSETT